MTPSSLFEHMAYLLGIAVALPTIFGVVAYLAVFERDDDDAHDHHKESDTISSLRKSSKASREPDPVYGKDWGNFDQMPSD